MAASTPVFTGGCLCGKVRYETYGEPFQHFVCHCHNCQRQSGSAFVSNTFFKTENVKIVQGAQLLKGHDDYQTKSGRPLRRLFCTECGSSVLGQPATKGIIIVTSGTFDDPHRFPPRVEGFTESKRPWVGELKVEPKPKKKAKL